MTNDNHGVRGVSQNITANENARGVSQNITYNEGGSEVLLARLFDRWEMNFYDPPLKKFPHPSVRTVYIFVYIDYFEKKLVLGIGHIYFCICTLLFGGFSQ